MQGGLSRVRGLNGICKPEGHRPKGIAETDSQVMYPLVP